MSRIGKQPIVIPEKTEVAVSDGSISVKGPLGSLSRPLNSHIAVEVKNKEVVVTPLNETTEARALWGTYASHISNMIRGVNEAFEKKLIVEGIGFKVVLEGNTLVLSVGFSHKVSVPIPDGLAVSIEKNTISIKGSNKEMVGQFAAKVRSIKKPEPYKGKGIRYDDEVVKRKQGKRAVT